jgi:Aspartyl protease
MKTRTTTLAWVIAATVFATAVAGAPAMEFAADVPLVMSDGMPCIEVRIGDGKPVLFGIDTGDVNSVIDTTVAKAAGLTLEAIPPPVPADVLMTKVAVLHVGSLEFRDRKAIVVDFVKNQMPPKMGGTLAYTFFKDRILQIDFRGRRVRISAPLTGHVALPEPSDSFSLITFGKSGPPIVVASGFGINGKAVTAQVDTLYTGSLLIYTASIDKLGLGAQAKTDSKEFFPYTDGGVTMRVSSADAETFHGLGFGHRLYFPTPGVHEPDSLFDATVGLGVLNDTVLTLNFHEHTISVQRPAAQDPDAPAANSAGVDPERPVSFDPTLVRVGAAADLLFEEVVPFLIKNFVGRP